MIKYLKKKDQINRKTLVLKNSTYYLYKFFFYKKTLEKKSKFKIMLQYQRIFAKVYKTKKLNRCLDTYRKRSTFRIVYLSKSPFKQYSNNAFLNGFKKSSW